MSAPSSDLDPARLSSLSPSARTAALRRSDLIARYRPGWWGTGLLIRDGTVVSQDPYPNDSSDAAAHPFNFPSRLVSPTDSSPLASEARAIMFAENRIILAGSSPTRNLAFLRAYSAADLARITRLDLRVPYGLVEEWRTSTGAPSVLAEFRDLVNFLAQALNIATVELALDAGWAFEIYQEQECTEAILGYVLQAYKDLVAAIAEVLKGKARPKTFRVYLACFHGFEAEAERMVMGPDYDSSKDAGEEPKVPSQKRNPYLPHGDVKDMDDYGGMQLS